jgi:hypothetical protein
LFAFFQLLKEERPGSKASFWTFSKPINNDLVWNMKQSLATQTTMI